MNDNKSTLSKSLEYTDVKRMSFIERDRPLRRGSQLHLSLQLHKMKIHNSNEQPKSEKSQSANSRKKQPKVKKIKIKTSSEGPTSNTYISF